MRVTWEIGVTSMNALEERFVMIKAGVIDLKAFAYKDRYLPKAVSRHRQPLTQAV